MLATQLIADSLGGGLVGIWLSMAAADINTMKDMTLEGNYIPSSGISAIRSRLLALLSNGFVSIGLDRLLSQVCQNCKVKAVVVQAEHLP